MTSIKILMSYHHDNFTAEDECSPIYEPAGRLNTLTAMRKANRDNYCTVKVQYKNKWKGQYLNNVTISYYRTMGNRMIHAITGDTLKGVLGSFDENQYFKVKMASCANASGTLFYLSPDEYENHQFCHVSQETRDRWFESK